MNAHVGGTLYHIVLNIVLRAVKVHWPHLPCVLEEVVILGVLIEVIATNISIVFPGTLLAVSITECFTRPGA